MRIYPPPPSTALKSERVWVLYCEDCRARETYPDIFARSAVRHIVARLAADHVCGAAVTRPQSTAPHPMHAGYAGR